MLWRSARYRRRAVFSIMNRIIFIVIIIACFFVGGWLLNSKRNGVEVGVRAGSDGKRGYAVINDEPASPATSNAAQELARYLSKVTGAEVPVLNSLEEVSNDARAMIVGNGALAKRLGVTADILKLKQDGVLIKEVDGNIVLAGEGKRGSLYAVYEFLEKIVGCRWWSAEHEWIPNKPELNLPKLDYRYEPAFSYRVPYTEEVKKHNAFAVKMRASGLAHEPAFPEKWGGSTTIVGFVHTFDPLVPSRINFPTHPEWGALRQGMRLPWTQYGAQPCLSSDGYLNAVKEAVLKRLEKISLPAIISVSQNDNQNRCLCPKCLAVEKDEGSPAGPIVRFVNQVAQEVKAAHPGVLVDTLAYTYSSPPPQKVRPLENVVIRLSTYHENHAKAFDELENQEFQEKLKTWAAISKQLYIWDYTTDFNDQWLLRPNLLKIGGNIRLFTDNGVKGVFSQGAFRQRTDFAALRAWLVSQLLWNPKQDERALIGEFLQGFYGAAAPFLWEYIVLVDETAASTPMLMGGGGIARIGFGKEFFSKASNLFDRAEAAVAEDPILLKRVKIERIAPEYLKVTDYPASIQQGDPLFASPADAVSACELLAKKVAELGLGDSDRYVENKLELAKIRSLPVKAPNAELTGKQKWLDFTAPNLRLNGFNKTVFLREEEDSGSGYVAATPAGAPAWNVQLTATPETIGESWDAHIRLKYTGKGTANVTFGGYDAATEAKTGNTTAALKEGEGFQWVTLRNTAVSERSYLYLSVTRGDEDASVLVDRIVLVRPESVQ